MNRMKKIIAFTFAFLTVLTMCGCNKRADYSQKISQLRTEIFIGKTDRFTLYCYGETRETPFETDGKTTEVRPFATFKIIPVKNEACEGEILVRFGAAGLNLSFAENSSINPLRTRVTHIYFYPTRLRKISPP